MIDIIKECVGANKIAIAGHIRPDGDCVGSTLALYLYLKKMLPEVKVVVYLEQPSDYFSCIKGYNDIDSLFEEKEEYDVFFVLDCSKERLGKAEPYFDSAKKTINIDHHITNNGCGMLNYIVTTASSTSELVFDLIEESELDIDIAKSIYIGIIHDTGVFQYSNTSPKTLLIASKLIQFPFDFSAIIDETFYEKTFVQSQILGRALLESILIIDGKCIVSSIDRKTMEFYQVDSNDLDGIVNQLRIIKGVECAVFMYEINAMEYKVSMRASDLVNVAEIAAYFGGGGHKKAAGCTMQGTFHDVINNLSLSIEEQLKNR